MKYQEAGQTMRSSTLTQTNLAAMGPQQSFIIYDLDLTLKERQDLDSLQIAALSHYENYGDLDFLSTEVAAFLQSLGANDAEVTEELASMVQRLVNNILQFTGQETVWVTMRAFPAGSVFKKPRWHADTHYYPPTGEQFKVAITLKGQHTLFYQASVDERKRLEPIRNDSAALAETLDESRIVVPTAGEGSIFIVGPDYAPVHTEPHITESRLFLSMIPGSKAQIREVYEKTPEQKIVSLLTAQGFFCYFIGPRLQNKYVVSPYEDTEILIFRVSETELNPADQYQLISTTVCAEYPGMSTELLPLDSRTLLKCIFPKGAIISLNDISAFVAKTKYNFNSDPDIFKMLQDYSNSLTSSSKQDTAPLPVSVGSFAVNTIIGRNTTGLFKPQPALTPDEYKRISSP